MICEPCAVERNRWLDTRPSQLHLELGIAYGSGAPHDVSLAGLRERARLRHERWRELVRFQRDLIVRTCREAGHVAEPQPRRVVQLDLLDLVA